MASFQRMAYLPHVCPILAFFSHTKYDSLALIPRTNKSWLAGGYKAYVLISEFDIGGRYCLKNGMQWPSHVMARYYHHR
jgi:hypothetical protein